jgi:hypothetical protein
LLLESKFNGQVWMPGYSPDKRTKSTGKGFGKMGLNLSLTCCWLLVISYQLLVIREFQAGNQGKGKPISPFSNSLPETP